MLPAELPPYASSQGYGAFFVQDFNRASDEVAKVQRVTIQPLPDVGVSSRECT